MKNKKTFLIIILLFVLLMGGASVLYRQLGQSVAAEQLSAQAPQPETAPEESEVTESAEEVEEEPVQLIKAPDFTVYDADGNEVHLSDYAGKPVVLNFWASWCGPCQMEMPDFEAKYRELGDDVQFLMVNKTNGGRETMESATTFIENSDYTFPAFYDPEADATMAYGAYSIPVTYFIDAEGYAVAHASGAINAEILQRGIDMIR